MSQRAEVFYDFLKFMKSNGHMNYRLKNFSGCNSEMCVEIENKNNNYVSFRPKLIREVVRSFHFFPS